MNTVKRNELYHHGIKGQKWGVRRFQNEDGTYTEEGKERRRKGDGRGTANQEQAVSGILSRMGKKEVGSIPPEVIEIGLPFVLEIATFAVSMLAVSHSVKKAHRKDMERNKEENGSFDDIKKIEGNHTKEQDMEAINPLFQKSTEYQMNCFLCSTAYEMRRRGYDVEASRSSTGRSPDDIKTYFNNAEVQHTATYRDFKEQLYEMPDGSRGNICTNVGPFSSKHSMVWEKEDGKVIIRDCQTNTTYDSIDKSIIRADAESYDFIRTDNLEVNKDGIMDAIRPRSKEL